VAKETAKEIKQIKKKIYSGSKEDSSLKKNAGVPADAFGDKKEKITVSRDPVLVEKDMEEDANLKKSVKKIDTNIEESKKAL